MTFQLTFLGTGTSAGVPMIGCDCPVCTSDDPRDNRTRPSVLVRYADDSSGPDTRQFLIDTAPEMRQQVIAQGLNRIDGVLYTHGHADHIFGLDDLRRFNAVMKTAVDIHAEPMVLASLRKMFPYVFTPENNINPSFVPTLIAHELEPAKPLDLFGATWTPIRLLHGRLPILGFRIDFAGKSIAYCTDVSSFPPESYPLLQDLDVLVIDGLRFRHHPTHLTIDQALEQIEQIKPKRAYLTHMAHDIKHADVEPKLPEGVLLSYDGLVVHISTPHARQNDDRI
jgi:phosphoribosyl 1,2-cyclic phosphate phosphodiesterase